jgi:hypothetical protein
VCPPTSSCVIVVPSSCNVALPSTLSSAVTVYVTRAPCSLVASTTMFSGTVRTGGVVSSSGGGREDGAEPQSGNFTSRIVSQSSLPTSICIHNIDFSVVAAISKAHKSYYSLQSIAMPPEDKRLKILI